MAWPDAITSNEDLKKFTFVQGVTRILEDGNDYQDLHEGVAIEVKLWLQANGIPDADDVTNSDDFKPAATHLFVAKLLRDRDPDLAREYNNKFLALMRSTRPDLPSPDAASGGTIAKITVIKQGQNHYTDRRGGGVFKTYRD